MRTALSAGAALALAACTIISGGSAEASPTAAASHRVVGHVYEPTNAMRNAVAIYDRYGDGTLRPIGTVLTGGRGTEESLGSQGAITRDGNLLFVVNAGDDSISALRIEHGTLRLQSRIRSGGHTPVSVTVRGGVGYVLNHGSDTIHGFAYDRAGHLRPLHRSGRSLTPNPAGGLTDAAQIQFSPDGRALAVTEKATNTIDTFVVRGARTGPAKPHASAGDVPYGFDFDRHGTLVVSEAAASSVSSYRLAPRFHPVTSALGDTQGAACWVVVTGHFAWVINGASSSVSSYRIGKHGSLSLVRAVAAATTAGPTDAAASPDGRNLYVRQGDGSVAAYRIGAHGALSPLGSASVTTTYGVAGLATD